ncbi:hypothetical protein [Micromonospora sp. b486]|uniref:hypothetical protein n=1 Tax=Micromonospora sp. b486 TaxID=3053986 RepID=UPI00259C8264|nr:hypothetical protein [Micromonospora sp. b486]MDM4777994.1 hypothetical protein [Micromonospora sp. b486]
MPQNQPADAIDRQEGDNVIRLSPKVFMSTEELAELLDVDPSTIRGGALSNRCRVRRSSRSPTGL